MVDELAAEKFVLDNTPNLQEITEQDVENHMDDFRDQADRLGCKSACMNKLEEMALADENHHVCLNSAAHHKVHFIRIQRDIHNILQTVLYPFDKNWDRTLDDMSGCHGTVKNKSMHAGSRARTTTSVSDTAFD